MHIVAIDVFIVGAGDQQTRKSLVAVVAVQHLRLDPVQIGVLDRHLHMQMQQFTSVCIQSHSAGRCKSR
jgi:hypothetical protein